MAQTKREIQQWLTQANTEPRHRFGQNFMIDANLVRLVADAARIVPNELVLEVGPGTGTLTEELLARQAKVVAIEIDRDLAALLRDRWQSEAKFTLIEGDALAGKHAINPELHEHIQAARRSGRGVKLVANLPYNIASPLVIELLIAGVDLLAFTVQKEVADRLRATEISDAYGPLSVMSQLLAKVELMRTLPPQAFWPMPKVESALVRMERADHLGSQADAFSRWVHAFFSGRRKTLRNALLMASDLPDAEGALRGVGLDPQLRPDQLSPAQCLTLYRSITPAA